MLVGETGTSKTATVSHFLHDLDKDTHLLLNINFSSRTTSLDVERNIKANVEKRTKEVYGPPSGKRLIIFLDDMNMPQARRLGLVLHYVSKQERLKCLKQLNVTAQALYNHKGEG